MYVHKSVLTQYKVEVCVWDKTVGETAGKSGLINVKLKSLHVWMSADVSISLSRGISGSNKLDSQEQISNSAVFHADKVFRTNFFIITHQPGPFTLHTGQRTSEAESMESTALSFACENYEVDTDVSAMTTMTMQFTALITYCSKKSYCQYCAFMK